MKLPELDSRSRKFCFIVMLNQVIDESINLDTSNTEIEAIWNTLDENQQQGVFERFSVYLMERALDGPGMP